MTFIATDVGGSISTNTVCDVLKNQGIICAQDEIINKLVFTNGKRGFKLFLSKFDILDKINWDAWAIEHVFRQVCWNIVKENIQYCELKLSIAKYIKHTNWTPAQVISFVYDVVQDECKKWDVDIRLTLSLKYESNRRQQRELADVIYDDKIAEKLVAIDLVGDESKFDYKFYKPIFNNWKSAGKGLEAHVGESQSEKNVKLAIKHLHVDRIAHGIKAVNDKNIMKLIRDSGVCLDIAISSNYYTGVVDDVFNHPAKELFDFGIPITIGTDDPVVLNTNLENEYSIASRMFSMKELKVIRDNSIKYAFKRLRP